MSTEVKEDANPCSRGADGAVAREGRRAQGTATRAALLDAARILFGERGYAETSIDERGTGAAVTKGAMYHHFSGKEDLFAAVYEQVQHEVSDRVVAEFLEPDPVGGAGHRLEPVDRRPPRPGRAAHRPAATPGRSWGGRPCATSRPASPPVPLRGVLRRAVRVGIVDKGQPLRPLALMLMGALSEACLYVADADDPVAAHDEVSSLVLRLIAGLRGPDRESDGGSRPGTRS